MNPIKVNNSFNIKPTLSNDSHESITSFQCNNQNLTTSYHCVRNQRSNFGTDNGKRKGTWEKYEDNQLIEAVKTIETHSWTKIANLVPSRTAKQCRERWINQLNPDLVHGNWTNEEDDIILKMRGQLGKQMGANSKKLSRRSANAIKNRYNSLATLTKKKEETNNNHRNTKSKRKINKENNKKYLI